MFPYYSVHLIQLYNAGMFNVAEHSATLYAAFAAVAAVHVILGLFVYGAIKEEEKPRSIKTD